MTEFQQDLVKLVLDKALLALIAVAFGYYLSRLLEDYRQNRAYDVFVMQERVAATMKASALVSEHFRKLMDVHAMVEKLAEKGKLTDEEAAPGFQYVSFYDNLKREVGALVPLLPPQVIEGLKRYIEETSGVAAVIKGNFEGTWPDFNELSLAHSRFICLCGVVIAAGSSREVEIPHDLQP